MIQDTPDGKTYYCTHENKNSSGVCDDCLGVTPNKENECHCELDGFQGAITTQNCPIHGEVPNKENKPFNLTPEQILRLNTEPFSIPRDPTLIGNQMPNKDWEEKFDAKFKCIQSDCDGNGCIPHQVAEDEWEAQQCQFHSEYIFPIKDFIKSLLTSHESQVREEIIEKIKSISFTEDVAGGNNKYSTVSIKLIEMIINLITPPQGETK